MKSLLEPEFRPGRLNVKELHLRSALCTSQQVSHLKGSAEFATWCESQRLQKQRRKQTGTLLQCVLAVSLLLLGYSLAKPEVSSASNTEATALCHCCHPEPLPHVCKSLFASQATLLDVSVPRVEYQALAADDALADPVFTQPVLQDNPLYNAEITDVRNSIEMATVETLTASIAPPEEVLSAEPAGPSILVPTHLESQGDLHAHPHISYTTQPGPLEHQNGLRSSQDEAYMPGVGRCDLEASQVTKTAYCCSLLSQRLKAQTEFDICIMQRC